MIGITGASGHLGSELMRLSPNALPIGRTMPTEGVDILIHAAAPNYKHEDEVRDFHNFNLAVWEYVQDTKPYLMVNVSTWWLYCHGEAKTIPYTRMKLLQMCMFPNATHVVPYSIYGDEPIAGRGFIPHLIEALRGGERITGLSDQQRDFIHVSDAARGIRAALLAPRGTYALGTRNPISPRTLAERYGITAGPWPEWPEAEPNYYQQPVPEWRPLIDLDNHITSSLEA